MHVPHRSNLLSKLKGEKSEVRTSPPPYPIEMSTHALPNSTIENDPNKSNPEPLQDGERYTAETVVSIPPG